MSKRKARMTITDTEGSARERAAPFPWTGRIAPETYHVSLRCVWHTRLVITPDQVPSGTRYDFQPGQTQPVDAKDVDTLLAMQHVQQPCCGAVVSPVLKLFERV